jgi:predicted transcriptional regulator
MNKTAKDLVQGQDLAWIRPDDLVDQAFQKMTRWNISSLPVIDAPAGMVLLFRFSLSRFAMLADGSSV